MAKDHSEDEKETLRSFLSKQFDVPSINLDEFVVGPGALGLVPKNVCEQHGLIPVSRASSVLVLAMADPRDAAAVAEVAALTGLAIEIVRANEDAIRRAIARHY